MRGDSLRGDEEGRNVVPVEELGVGRIEKWKEERPRTGGIDGHARDFWRKENRGAKTTREVAPNSRRRRSWCGSAVEAEARLEGKR